MRIVRPVGGRGEAVVSKGQADLLGALVRTECVDQPLMLGGGVADALGVVLEHVAQRVHAGVGGLDQCHQQTIRAPDVENGVEGAVAVTRLVQIARCLGGAEQSVLAAHCSQVGCGHVGRGEPSDLALQQRCGLDGLAQLRLVEGWHACAGPPCELDHALGLEAAQRLAHGDHAHLQLGSHLGEDDSITGAIGAVEHALADHLIRPFRLRLEHVADDSRRVRHSDPPSLRKFSTQA